jgi:hypothetical protein
MIYQDPLGFVEITAALLPDERLLWSARPRPGLQPRSQFLLLVAGAIFLIGALFWLWQGRIVGPIDLGDPSGRVVLAVRLLQGLGLIVPALALAVPALLDLLVRRRAVYALTDRRVIISSGLSGRQVTSRPLASLTELSLDVRADGSGTIGLGPEVRQASQAFGFTWTSPASTYRIEGIDDARAVYARILEAQRALEVRRVLDAQRLLAAAASA